MWAWKGRVISVFDRNQGLCFGTLITKFALSLYNIIIVLMSYEGHCYSVNGLLMGN